MNCLKITDEISPYETSRKITSNSIDTEEEIVYPDSDDLMEEIEILEWKKIKKKVILDLIKQ